MQERGALQVPAFFLFGEPYEHRVYGFLHAETLEVRNAVNDWTIAPHFHPDFDQLSILLAGTCEYMHDGLISTTVGPSCIFTKAGTVHRFAYQPQAHGFVISVSPDFVDSIASLENGSSGAYAGLSSVRAVTIANVHAARRIDQQCGLLCHHVEAKHRHRRDILRYNFGSLLLELDGSSAVEANEPNPARPAAAAADLFERFQALIRTEVGEAGFSNGRRPAIPTVERFAAELGATPYALNAACDALAGTSAKAMLHSAMVYQASRLLLYTDRPVKEISYLLGYSHASHFVRFFKQHRNLTPEAFRRGHGA